MVCATFDAVNVAFVTAEPDNGWIFVEWQDENGNAVSTDLTYSFTVTDDIWLVAVCEPEAQSDQEDDPDIAETPVTEPKNDEDLYLPDDNDESRYSSGDAGNDIGDGGDGGGEEDGSYDDSGEDDGGDSDSMKTLEISKLSCTDAQ